MSTLTANRTAKAARLADVLRTAGAEATDLPHLSELGWKLAAMAAGTNQPSAETRTVVAELLRHEERVVAAMAAAPADVLEGLPQ